MPQLRRFLLVICIALVPLAAQNQEPHQLDYGFEMRVRNEDWNNIFDYNDTLDDERVQIRYRTRAWVKAPLGHLADLTVGLNQESLQYFTPDRPSHFDEIVFETANLDFKELFKKGLSLRVGRQNIMKGEGFLFLEGTPWDGSRTLYSNAAVLAYTWKKSRLEAMGIVNPRTDIYMPNFNERHRQPLIDWNEQAFAAYYTDDNHKNTSLEAYYVLKFENGDPRAPANPQYQADQHTNTAGGRVIRKLSPHWSLTGEMAAQWGRREPGVDTRGLGGYGYVKRTLGDRDQHYFTTGYWGMSGDNPATREVEGWNPLFSRWPKWSELYVYTQFCEKGPGYWTNTGMWQVEGGYSPWRPINIRFTYYRMHAFHPFPGDPRTFGAGRTRGDLPQVRMDFAIGRKWKGHVLYEHLNPGNFYSERSQAYFLRFEIIYTWLGKAILGS